MKAAKKIFYSILVNSLLLNLAYANTATITNFKWGEVQVTQNNTVHTYRDCKVWLNESKEWDWSATGTRHNPGIQITDFEEFIHAVDIIILSRGVDLVLQVKPETVTYLKEWIQKNNTRSYYILQSEEAVKKYNQLVAEGKKVGIVLHSTC
jgi:hypothetical protein